MKKGKIAIDIDDVLADSTESLRLLVNKRLSMSLPKSAYRVPGRYWGYYERVWSEHGIAGQLDFKALNQEMEIDQSHVPVMANAQYAVHELVKDFHIVFVTSRDASWEKATKRWLHEQFGDENVEVYFCESHKNEAAKSKGEICKDLGADLLIDDNPSHCQSATDEGIATILFGEYGWHQDAEEDAVRCKDWPSVVEYVYEWAR